MSIRVDARPGESIERLIIRFKRLINRDGVLKETKRRRTFEKPSERARRKEKERRRTLRKAETPAIKEGL